MENKITTLELIDGNTSYTFLSSQINLSSSYTLSITDEIVNTYKYIIAIGGGGNNDDTCSTNLTLSGTQVAIINESINSTLSSSKAVSCRIAIITGFVSGDTIRVLPDFWGSVIYYGVA